MSRAQPDGAARASMKDIGPQKARLRVLGVDPAAAGPTGYAVIESDGRDWRALRFGALRPASRSEFPARLCEIHRMLAGLVEEYAPDAIAIEAVFAAPNLSTSLRLAEVRGVVLLAAAEAGIAAHSYSPREVKAAVAGYGGATKQQIQRMVGALLGLAEPPRSPDAADALAVALCHVFAARARARFAQATGLPAKSPSHDRSASARATVRLPLTVPSESRGRVPACGPKPSEETAGETRFGGRRPAPPARRDGRR
jgi:crossover junction endodeoxyribonuclease RuvC